MKVFFRKDAKSGRYGYPETSTYIISFNLIAVEVDFEYKNYKKLKNIKVEPRDWILSDEKLVSFPANYKESKISKIPNFTYKKILISLFTNKLYL